MLAPVAKAKTSLSFEAPASSNTWKKTTKNNVNVQKISHYIVMRQSHMQHQYLPSTSSK